MIGSNSPNAVSSRLKPPEYVSSATPDLMPHPSEYMGQASMLYLQQADGHFVDVTKEYGLFYPDSKCMGLTLYD